MQLFPAVSFAMIYPDNTFVLARTWELVADLGDETMCLRIELFRALASRTFRVHVWRHDMYQLKPRSTADMADEIVMVDWSGFLRIDLREFRARSTAHAAKVLFNALNARLAEFGPPKRRRRRRRA